MIHILNKKQFIYSSKKEFRKNVIVMGDILEDLRMVDEKEHTNILGIGYLNDLEKNQDLIPSYLNTFDILVAGDGTLHTLNFLL